MGKGGLVVIPTAWGIRVAEGMGKGGLVVIPTAWGIRVAGGLFVVRW